ncbi:Werner syndrome ATP-dependent helicase-like isoform X2 [Oopsacas minuta]|uniref:ATP-dependent DNA helicase n=1 Tax=Oopsacas minuta TaxID=111878 RepID=A0AAV7JNH0_9METZ|nr:Werner syndrome ATP-dependent helicase-like isoform X2 [Oopsacas minuta]
MAHEFINLDIESFMLDDDDDDPIYSLKKSTLSPEPILTSDNSHPNQDHLRVLKSEFGHSQFKPTQWTVISTILDNYSRPSSMLQDQCIVMATGFGKSLCYQFVPVYKQSLALVISPLISLMQDQVRLMEMRGIPAIFLGSGQENSSLALSRLYQNEFRLLYISPEYCINAGPEFIANLHKQVPICLVAIDEAHCVSSWGHDFRPEYGELSQLREWLPEVPFLALTATASELVRKDIVSRLSLRNTAIRTSTLNRPNQYFEIHQKSKDIETDMKMLLHSDNPSSLLKKYTFNGSCIVYCISRNATEEVSGVLSNMGVKCDYYHAGLTPKRRREIHNNFVRDEIECIIATVAFGMGIDKPDIRLVIHYGAPREMESYMQEAGRAGRDGLPCRCVVFYSAKDFNILQRIVLSGLDWNASLKEHRAKMMQKMEKFLCSCSCRRQQLLEHFDEVYNPDEEIHCCDFCTRKLREKKTGLNTFNADKTRDFTQEAKLLLESVRCRDGRVGVGQHAYLLTGSSQTSEWLKSHHLYGTGKNRNYKWWMAFGRLLQYESYLDIKPVSHGYGSTISISQKAKDFLANCEIGKSDYVKLIPTPEMDKATGHSTISYPSKPSTSNLPSYKVVQINTNTVYQSSLLLPQISNEMSYELVKRSEESSQDELTPEQEQMQQNLYLRLLVVRNQLASKFDCAPYMICSNRLATNLATIRPSNIENLKQIDLVSHIFCNRYGEAFLEEIKNFCVENPEMKADSFTKAQVTLERSPLKKRTVANPDLDGLNLAVYERYSKDRLSIAEICEHYSMTSDIVYSCLNQALDAGYLVDYRKLGLDQGIERLILDVVRAPPINSDLSMTNKIKDLLKHLPEWMIDMSLTLIRITFGMNVIIPTTQQLSQHIQTSSNTSQTSLPLLERNSSTLTVKPNFSSQISVYPETQVGGATKESSESRPKKRKLPNWL